MVQVQNTYFHGSISKNWIIILSHFLIRLDVLLLIKAEKYRNMVTYYCNLNIFFIFVLMLKCNLFI